SALQTDVRSFRDGTARSKWSLCRRGAPYADAMRKSLTAAILLIALCASGQGRQRAVRHPGNDARLQEILKAAATAVLTRTPGLSIAVQQGSAYADGGFGMITPENSEAATAHSIYWIASAT